MPNYKKMYYDLFNAITDAIHDLQNAQRDGEETYIESEDTLLFILPNPMESDETAAE